MYRRCCSTAAEGDLLRMNMRLVTFLLSFILLVSSDVDDAITIAEISRILGTLEDRPTLRNMY